MLTRKGKLKYTENFKQWLEGLNSNEETKLEKDFLKEVTLIVPSTWDIEVAFYIGWFINNFDDLSQEPFTLAISNKQLEISNPSAYYQGIKDEIMKGGLANKKGIELHLSALYAYFNENLE